MERLTTRTCVSEFREFDWRDKAQAAGLAFGQNRPIAVIELGRGHENGLRLYEHAELS